MHGGPSPGAPKGNPRRRSSMSKAGHIKAKREAAERARRLARTMTSETYRARLLTYAADLDAEADALESRKPQLPQAQPGGRKSARK